MPNRIKNIFYLAGKELRSLSRDVVMLFLIFWAFTFSIYTGGKGQAVELRNTPIAIVDHDRSKLSGSIIDGFYKPYFKKPVLISPAQTDPGMDSGTYTFVMDIPPGFERDLLANRRPKIQLNIDATQMKQAFTGNRYIQSIVTGEVNSFLKGHRTTPKEPLNLVVRYKFNPTLEPIWFGAVMQLINQVTMLAVILTGAALVREREHGTLEHLLVMPLTPVEIMAAKICANGLVVLLASSFSLCLVIEWILRMPVAGSVPLFIFGTALHLFSVTSLGIFLGTVSRTMPQLGLLMMLVILPLQMLSGGSTPFESMPKAAQILMQVAPTTHFVSLAQAILYRGAGFDVVWPNFLAIIGIGVILFLISSALFRQSMAAAR